MWTTSSRASSSSDFQSIFTLNTMANIHEQDLFWLQTHFQNTVEVALQLSRSPAPEETPFVHKYEAIEMLKGLLATTCRYQFITHCLLGELYNDV
jgi:hypothetical protein